MMKFQPMGIFRMVYHVQFIFFCSMIIFCGCTLMNKIEESTQAIENNLQVVRESTHVIESNKNAVATSTNVIKNNRNLIERSNQAILDNQRLIERANRAIVENQRVVSSSTNSIKENAQAVEQATALLANLKLDKRLGALAAGAILLLLMTPSILLALIYKNLKALNK